MNEEELRTFLRTIQLKLQITVLQVVNTEFMR